MNVISELLSLIILSTLSYHTKAGVAGDDCSWCNPPDLSNCITDPSNWKLVRAVGPPRTNLFPNTDSLMGTDAYSDDGAAVYNIGTFSDYVPGFNQFLFVTGDCQVWLITSRDAIGWPYNSDSYGNQPRDVCLSSEDPNGPTTPRWYNRNGGGEDPWLSTTDHGDAITNGKIVYGESNYGGPHAANSIVPHNGIYVYTRNAGQLDAIGCTPIVVGCGANQPATFDWDILTGQGMTAAGVTFDANTDVTLFGVDESDLSLNIRVELQYFGKASADDEDEANFGVTYVLDFEDFDAHRDDIDAPGTCQNRNDDDFNGKDFVNDYWNYSMTPVNDIGSDDYLAYPPPDGEVGDWNISMADDCDTVVYEGKFTWQDLRDCEPFGGGSSYTDIVTDANWLNLTGTFYINIVSPFWYDSNYGFYRVYQILSQPFIIAISSVVNVLGSTGINVMTMSVIAVYKEDEGPNPDSSRDYYADFKLVLLTECSDYLVLTRDPGDPYVFNVPGINDPANTFTAPSATENNGCLTNKGFICSQLWEIEAIQVPCTDSNGRDFSGNYQLTFEPECRPASDIGAQLNTYCTNFLAAHPQLTSGTYIQLNTDLVWEDDICNPEVFIVRLEADMAFYSNDSFIAPVPANYLYQVGEDTIYVEVTTNFPSDTLTVFDTEIMEVHICTFDPLLDPETNYNDPVNDIANFGCFNGNRDTGSDQYFYKIFEDAGDHISPPTVSLFDFTEYQDGIANTERFSFKIPYEVARDRLFIQVEIEVELQEIDGLPTTRRLLARTKQTARRSTGGKAPRGAHANKLSHFIQPIGINHGQEIIEQPPRDEPKFKEPNNNNPPEQYYPPQQPYQPVDPVSGPATYTINLSSPWVIALGGLLGLVLIFNIVFMAYRNCCGGSGQGRVSFIPLKGKRKGYAKVNVDSEFDSEAAMIQNYEK